MVGIYKIVNPKGKVYIGQSANIEHRMGQYARVSCKSQTKLYHSIKKYGWDNHVFEILCECDFSELNPLEEYYGSLYNCIEEGLNLKECGGARGKMSEETKRKMSKPRNLTSEQRAILVDRLRKLHTGKKKSEACKEKVRQSKLGVPRPFWMRSHISKINSKPFGISNNWLFMEFESVTKACEFLKCSRKEISKAFKGTAIYKGYNLMYL